MSLSTWPSIIDLEKPTAVGIADWQSSLLGQSKTFSAYLLHVQLTDLFSNWVWFSLLFLISLFILLEYIADTCNIADMVHKMNKQCQQMSNAELLGEVVSGITEGKKILYTPNISHLA